MPTKLQQTTAGVPLEIESLCNLWYALSSAKEIVYAQNQTYVTLLKSGVFSTINNITFQDAQVSMQGETKYYSVLFSAENLEEKEQNVILFIDQKQSQQIFPQHWIIINIHNEKNQSIIANYNKYIDRLGFCGLLHHTTPKSKVLNFILNAAEERQLSHAKTLLQSIKDSNLSTWEQVLFEQTCYYLGKPSYSPPLLAFAQKQNFERIQQSFDQPLEKTKQEILGNWLFSNNLLAPKTHYNLVYQKQWEHFPVVTQRETLQHKGRPANHPIRLFVGLFYHLNYVCKKGIFTTWLACLQNIFSMIEKNQFSQRLLQQELNKLFPMPEEEGLYRYYLPTSLTEMKKPMKCIGTQKQIIIFINVIIPVFLAWSLQTKEKDLQRILLAIFLVFPYETENHKIKIIKKKLACTQKYNNLALHQGLIQLFDSYCGKAKQQCSTCLLPFVLQN